MEKLIDGYLRESLLTRWLLHQNQHAYQPRKSYDTALHQLAWRIEAEPDNKKIALEIFFDIEGVFETKSILNFLHKKGSETRIYIAAPLEKDPFTFDIQISYNCKIS